MEFHAQLVYFFCMSSSYNPYLIRIPSLHLSLDRERLFTNVGWIEIHAPASLFQRVQRISCGCMVVMVERIDQPWLCWSCGY